MSESLNGTVRTASTGMMGVGTFSRTDVVAESLLDVLLLLDEVAMMVDRFFGVVKNYGVSKLFLTQLLQLLLLLAI